MALASRAALIDLAAKLEVLKKDNGCVLDLSAILDLSVCPSIEVHMPKPHTYQVVDADFIFVTPTSRSNPSNPSTPSAYGNERSQDRRAVTPAGLDKRNNNTPGYCKKSGVDFDLLALLSLDLVANADLKVYLELLGLVSADIKIDLDADVNLSKRIVDVDALVDIDVDADINADVDVDITKRGRPASSLIDADVKAKVGVNKRNPLLDVKVDADVNVDLNLLGLNVDVNVDLDIDVNSKPRRVRHAVCQYQPTCGRKIPDNTPGCQKTTATNAGDCLAKCHKHAIDVAVAAKAKVGNLVNADIATCTGISFDRGLQVDNCIMATVDLRSVALVKADVNVDALVIIR